MPRGLLLTLVLCASFAAASPKSKAAESGRYLLSFTGGERLRADDLPGWPIPTAADVKKVNGRNVFKDGSPVRLIRDQEIKVETRVPLMVLANGDILNGLPKQLAASDGRQGQPQRVVVQLDSPLMPLDGVGVSVRTDRVQRIIGQETRLRKPPPQPGTVLLLDGRELKGSSIRWREYGLSVLTDDGIVQAAFTELADVVFPQVDHLAAVVEDSLSAGSLSGPAIMRMALRSGAVLTTCRASREVERSRSRRSATVEVMYYVQPAWSSNPVAVPEAEIAWVGYRRADEVPLSLLPAETAANSRLIGEPQEWLRNRSQTGPFVSRTRDESDLGLATHSDSQIVFALPAGAVSFSTIVGLDRVAGDGGCVRCSIADWDAAAKKPGKQLWDSGILVGSRSPKATGAVDVTGLKHIVLITGNAHDERPAGADPLDIRDDVCWLAPLVVVDPAQLRDDPAFAVALPGLNAWEKIGTAWQNTKIGHRWNEAADRWEAVLTVPEKEQLKLRRTATISSSNDVLELMTAVSQNPTEQQLELKVNGQILTWQTSEDRTAMATRHERYVGPWLRRNNRFTENKEDLISDSLAYWWDLQPYRGREVNLELTISGGNRPYHLVWHDASLRSGIGNLPADGELPKVDVPLTDLPIVETSGVRGRGEPRKDMLPYTGKYAEPIRFLGQIRTGGYGMIRNTYYTVELKPEYKKFVAVVGGVKLTSGHIRVMVDDQVLWEKGKVSALAPAELIELAIPPGSKRLTLLCGADGGYDSAAAWSDAGFVK
jgi:hypothetical protein